jgi:hypothetical protein
MFIRPAVTAFPVLLLMSNGERLSPSGLRGIASDVDN